MKHTRTLSILSLLLFAAPQLAFAAEVQVFRMGDTDFALEVSSITDPVMTNEPTGINLSVSTVNYDKDPDLKKAAGVPGLSSELAVTVFHSDSKQVLTLAAGDEEGAYTASLKPTKAGEYSYQIVGTLNNTAIDATFKCSNEDVERTVPEAAEGASGAVMLAHSGRFGCPTESTAVVFPAPPDEVGVVKTQISALQQSLEGQIEELRAGSGMSMTDIITLSVAAIGALFGLISFVLWWREVH